MKSYQMLFIKISIIIIVGVCVYFIYTKDNKVLIIHSYNTDYNWVQQQDIGSSKVFDKYPEIIVRHHYMDLKNNKGEKFKSESQRRTLDLIENWKPDVMIIADDIAQQLIGSKFVNHPDISIVFCAVNGWVDKYGYDNANNVTGIFERKPLFAIKEVLLMLSKNKNLNSPNIVFICDTSDSVTAELSQFEEFDWKPLIWNPPLRANNFNEWKRHIYKANQFANFILVSDYREFKLPNGEREPIPPMEIMSWTEEHSMVPLIGMSLINVDDGGMLSVFNSGYEQGEVAAKIAVKILRGTSPKDISRQFTKRFLTSVNKTAVEQRDLQVSELFIEFSESSDGNID